MFAKAMLAPWAVVFVLLLAAGIEWPFAALAAAWCSVFPLALADMWGLDDA